MSQNLSPALQSKFSLAPSSFVEAVNFAEMMSKASLVPRHLKNSPSDCLAVVLQATRWEMDPFAVAQKTCVIQDKLMYEGQLVAAVINVRGGLEEELEYEFSGEGLNRVVKVIGKKKNWKKARSIELTASQAREINRNGQMAKNPDQQMCYIGARIWARRNMPHLMLGVYTPDEIDVTPVEVTEVSLPAKLKGVASFDFATSEKPSALEVATTTSEEQVVPAANDTPTHPVSDLSKFQFGEATEFEVQGRTFFEVKLISGDSTLTTYWAGEKTILPAPGTFACVKLEEKKSSKSGSAPKTFITEIRSCE